MGKVETANGPGVMQHPAIRYSKDGTNFTNTIQLSAIGEKGTGKGKRNNGDGTNCFTTRWRVFLFLAFWQSAFIVLFGVFVDYDVTATPPPNGTIPAADNPIGSFYPMFQDIHVMMFIGFGFLMTFLKRYGFSSVGFNFLVAAFVLQWSTLIFGFLHWEDGRHMKISVETMIISDFAAASVLIAMGAVLGKVNHIQLCMMAAIQVVLQQVNEWIGLHKFHATDVGESVYVHTFGAYFGLAVSRVLFHKHVHEAEHKETSVYHSDLFSMIGTVFLWMYWPSFNAGGIEVGDRKHRTVLNTYFSLAACCVVTFALSALLDKNKKSKFNMVHIQNSTLAGGVAVGTTSDMVIHPYGALLTGTVAAILSVLGFRFLTPFLSKKLGIHDTCGVNNLHGMPGIMAGLSGILVSGIATFGVYQNSLFDIWPARDPGFMAEPRSGGMQAAYQAAALATTLAIALVGGVVTGLLLKLPIWGQPEAEQIFDDTDFWEIPEDGFPTARNPNLHLDAGHLSYIHARSEEWTSP